MFMVDFEVQPKYPSSADATINCSTAAFAQLIIDTPNARNFDGIPNSGKVIHSLHFHLEEAFVKS